MSDQDMLLPLVGDAKPPSSASKVAPKKTEMKKWQKKMFEDAVGVSLALVYFALTTILAFADVALKDYGLMDQWPLGKTRVVLRGDGDGAADEVSCCVLLQAPSASAS